MQLSPSELDGNFVLRARRKVQAPARNCVLQAGYETLPRAIIKAARVDNEPLFSECSDSATLESFELVRLTIGPLLAFSEACSER